ncbi:MAG: hypothetical protein IJ740_17790 [Ruminococcus sp.]|nr:hypothetical protein [Ruminococcus sp.]
MFKKLITAALALGLVFGSAAVLPEGGIAADTIVSADAASYNGFTINPDSSDWEDITNTLSGVDCAYRFIGDKSDMNYATANFNIIYSSISGVSSISYDQLLDALKKQFTNEGYTLLSSTTSAKINGYKACKVTGLMTTDNDLEMKMSMYVLTDSDSMYTVTYGSAKSVYGKLESKFDNVFKTFSLKSNPHAVAKKSIAKAKVTVNDITYKGRAVKPKVTVKLSGKTLKKGTDYTLTYKNNKNVGKASVTVKGKGGYKGKVTKTFKINPKKTGESKVTSPASKKIKATYKKVSGVTGYEIKYSTKKSFAKSATKTATVKGAKSTSKTISGLNSGKTYYVKIRTYKTVKGKKYYSGFTKVRTIKVK